MLEFDFVKSEESTHPEARVGRSNVWVAAEIEIEHEGVCSLDEDAGVAGFCGCDERDGINDKGDELSAVFLPNNQLWVRTKVAKLTSNFAISLSTSYVTTYPPVSICLALRPAGIIVGISTYASRHILACTPSQSP